MNTKEANKCENSNNIKLNTLYCISRELRTFTLSVVGNEELMLLITVSVEENNGVRILNSGRTLPCYLCGIKNITGVFQRKDYFTNLVMFSYFSISYNSYQNIHLGLQSFLSALMLWSLLQQTPVTFPQQQWCRQTICNSNSRKCNIHFWFLQMFSHRVKNIDS